MIIHLNITQTEVNVLKKALRTYPKQKKLTNGLIELIEYQEGKQRGKDNKEQAKS